MTINKGFLCVYSKFDFGDHKQELGAELRHLTSEPVQTDCTRVVYLVRAQLDLMKSICSQIHHDTSKGIQREYFLYFVPRRAVVCEKVCFPVLMLCWNYFMLKILVYFVPNFVYNADT